MCDPKPGPRCSAHTEQELKSAAHRLGAAEAELERFPDDQNSRRRADQAQRNYATKLAAYDSSPRGQRDLQNEIRTSPDPDSAAVDELRTRLYVGRATRIAQKRALARAKGLSAEEENLDVAKALRRLRHPDGGYTRDPRTGREVGMGFFVSPYPDRERPIPAADLSFRDVRGFARDNADLLTRDGHYEGAWHDPDTGVVSLDVSIRVESAEEARRLCQEHQQAAFYDPQMGGSVNVTNSGGRERIAAQIEGN